MIRQLVRAAVLDLYKTANRKWALDKEQVVKLIEAARGREERGEKCFAPFPVVIVLQWSAWDSENFGSPGSTEERHRV